MRCVRALPKVASKVRNPGSRLSFPLCTRLAEGPRARGMPWE